MRIRLAMVLAMGTMLAASACGGAATDDEGADASDAADAVQSTAAEAAEGEADETTGGEGFGACDDAAVADALADIVDTAGVELTADDSMGDSLSCTWGDTDEVGPAVYLTVTPATDSVAMTEEVLDSMGQTPVDDDRFASVDALLVEVLGCEEATAGSVLGCALGVYGSYDVTLQVLFAEEVTVDQMVEATWAITEPLYG